MKATVKTNSAKLRLEAQTVDFNANGFQRTSLGEVEGDVVDILEIEPTESMVAAGIKTYKKVFLTNTDGDWTLRAINERADELTGKESVYSIARGKSENNKNNYYIMSAQ